LPEEDPPTEPEPPPVEDEDEDDVSAGLPVVHAAAEANRKTMDHLAAALEVKRRVTFRSLVGVRDQPRRERNL